MLVRYTILYSMARFLPGILGILTTAILTRLLTPATYGTYSLVLVIMLLTSNIGFDWLEPSLLRFYEARRGDPRAFATFFCLFAIVAAISAVAIVPAWMLSGSRLDQVPVFALGIVLAWCYSWFELVSNLEIANFNPALYLKMSLVRGALILVGAGAAAWLTRDPLWTAGLTGLGIFCGALLGSFRHQRLGFQYFDRSFAMQILAFGLPVAVTLGMNGFVNNGTRALLGMFDSTRSLGLYTAAYALVQQSLLVMGGAISSASYPLIVRAFESGDAATTRRQILDNGTLLLAIIAPACLGMALTARGFSAIALGPEFRSSAVVLTPWMAAGAFFGSIRSYFFDQAFLLSRRTGVQSGVMIVAAISAIGLSVLLIPRMGALGAAIAVALAMAISCLHSAIAGRYVFDIPIPVGQSLRILLSCAFMALVVLLIPVKGVTGFVLQVLLGAIAYAGAVFSLNVLNLRARIAVYLPGRTR